MNNRKRLTAGISICILLGFMLGFFPSWNPGSLAQSADLFSYWNFDEGQGTQAFDSSGNGNTATLINSPTWKAGMFGGGLQFDGVNDYARTNLAGLNPSTTDFTVAAWFQVDRSGLEQTIISQENGTGVGRVWLWINRNNKLGSFFGGSNAEATTVLAANTWYHGALVKTGSILTFYLNGAADGSATKTIEAATGVNRIGADKWGSGRFNGTLDEVQIYRRALSGAEITQLYNTVPASTATPTATFTAIATDTPTFTPVATATLTHTASFTPVAPTPTHTPTFTPVASSTPTHTPTFTPVASTPTHTPTLTPAASATSTHTATPTLASTHTPTPTFTFTPLPSPTSTATGSTLTPAAHWPLDEGGGATTRESISGALANLVNGPVWITGRVANAIGFDGNNDVIDTPGTQFPSAVTITAWVNASPAATTSSRILYKQAEVELILEQATNQIIFGKNFSGGWGYWRSSSNVIVDGAWTHIALTYNSGSTANHASLYINGGDVPLSRTMSPAGTSVQNANRIALGGMPNRAGRSFAGGLDEIKIFNRVLTAAEVQSEYASYTIQDTTPPAVAIVSLASGTTVSHQMTVTALASDNAGIGGSGNSGVQFKIDGLNWGGLDTSAPFTLPVDTTQLSNGSHVLEAVATDIHGLSATSAPVTIHVDNLTPRPNIILVLTDDQRADLMRFMPLTSSIFSTNAVKFDQATVSDPLCCPSRATLLTGQYAHNHGVVQNWPPNGGATVFNDRSTLATWLQASGYRTAYIGRYFNDYDALGTYIPPGWSEWQVQSSDNGAFYNYDMNENGVLVHYGSTDLDYSTDVFTRKSITFIQSANNQPFFLIYAPYAPHEPTTPASQDIGAFANHPNWRPPSYNEADVSDKPTWVRNLPFISPTLQSNTDAVYRRQLETLQSVDRGVRDLFNTLAATGKLNNTLVIYTSDNGLSMGEHRWTQSKNCVYEECIRVPIWVYFFGLASRNDASLVQNIDFAPSIADLAGVIPTSPVNGMSFINLLFNAGTAWRTESLIEYLGHAPERDFYAVRTGQYIYSEYANGERELYDLISDPYQLVNVITNPAYAQVVSQLQSNLYILKNQ